MITTAKEVLTFVEENDVKFIRLAFCDLMGLQKNISIMPEELAHAFEHGISFDAHAIMGFGDITQSDLLLFPDPSTLTILPWRPQSGRVVRFFCDIRKPDGNAFWGDTRNILKNVMKEVLEEGYVCRIGAECEFYLFKSDEDGNPTRDPYDQGGYLDIAPLDKGENVRREICLTLEDMGICPESSHHEQGPGQNEIDFRYSDALSCADHILSFKNVVKNVASRNGLYASFAPKPLPDEAGNGLHINLSLAQNGLNMFKHHGEHSRVAESFIAGILKHAKEITAFLNPIPNSYERLGKHEAPRYISWSHGNRSQLIRIPYATKERVRMELRSPDPSINPYLAFALLIKAGMDGVHKEWMLPESTNADLFHAGNDITDALDILPQSIEEALDEVMHSPFIADVLNTRVLESYEQILQAEILQYHIQDADEDFMKNYFKKL